MFEDRLRTWVFVVLGAVFALQLYFVQELFAALLLLGAAFFAIALFVGAVVLLQEGGQRAAGWLEMQANSARALWRGAAALSAEVSKKPFHRPHSPPAP